MLSIWSMSGVAFILSCLIFLAALFRLPPGRNFSMWRRLMFILLSTSTGVTSGASLFGIGGTTPAALNFGAFGLPGAAVACLFWKKRAQLLFLGRLTTPLTPPAAPSASGKA